MTTFQGSFPFDFGVAASLRQAGSWVKSVMQGAGWKQTNDTGQVDWTTVVPAPAPRTMIGFEIWRMDDALQATAPVFLKLEYWSNDNSASYNPRLKTTVGTGTDGAGNLTGRVSSTVSCQPRVTLGNTNWPSRASGDTNRIAVWLWFTDQHWSGNEGVWNGFSVERTHDANGNDTADGVLLLAFKRDVSYCSYLPMTGPIPPMTTRWAGMAPTGISSGSDGNNVHIYPIRGHGYDETSPSLNWWHYFPGDLAQGVPAVVSGWDGNPHTILPTFWNSHGTWPTCALAMRWD